MAKPDKTAVLLVNLGTPDSPSVRDVRRYLSSFLGDRRIIDLPWLLRKLLVNGIIVPFRAPKSAKLYRKLWIPDGSPLLLMGNRLRTKLQTSLGGDYEVFLAMRYGNPNLKAILEITRAEGFGKLFVIPLFPHYASSTTGSIGQMIMETVARWHTIPEIKIAGQFYNNPRFLKAFCHQLKDVDFKAYDHIVFSYHGLPLSHVEKTHPGITESEGQCAQGLLEHNRFCYNAVCHETSRLIARQLGIEESRFTTSFQSRMNSKWLPPFSDKIIVEKAAAG
ncbi:MAG: ferrochelatase, partial [Prolixibacteraceae bacterium]|nr:ferrochelatase [Prolixibacteraceae bacterium]